MKKIIKLLLIINLLLVPLTGGVYGFSINTPVYNKEAFRGQQVEKDLFVTPRSIDRRSQEYINELKRLDLVDLIFTSEVYGEFKVEDKLLLYRASEVNDNCAGESVSYYFSGALISTGPNGGWGLGYKTKHMNEKNNNNYFCPDSGNWNIILESKYTDDISFFEDISLGNDDDSILNTVVTTIDARGNEVTNDIRTLFDDRRVSIGGSVNQDIEILGEFDGGTGSLQASRNHLALDTSSSATVIGELGHFRKTIKKNVIKNTTGREWNPISGLSLNNLSQEYNLYEGSEGLIHGDGNTGNILTLGSRSNLIISGQKYLIVKGGNLYINTDITYSNPSSMLTIVVLRDEENPLQGGNIYIDPYVTNIDANLVAEGSLLSYDGTNIINAVDNPSQLRRQLLIFGTVASRNTIGKDIAPYGSDLNIGNNYVDLDSNNYNFEHLRSFQPISSNEITSGGCNELGRITAIGNVDGESFPDAFAGKKFCYYDDLVNNGRRSTHRLSPVVIEYNQRLQSNPPSLFINR